MISYLFWIVPISALLALLFAWIFYRSMITKEEGTDRMKEIAAYVREGAMAYLKRQYTVVGKVFIILVILLPFLPTLVYRIRLYPLLSLQEDSFPVSADSWE